MVECSVEAVCTESIGVNLCVRAYYYPLKLIYLCLSTDCFMGISLHSQGFFLKSEEKSPCNSQTTNADT